MSSNINFEHLNLDSKKSPRFQDFRKDQLSVGDTFNNRASYSSMTLELSQDELLMEQTQRFTGIGLEIASSIVGNLIAHPCIVLRRQCQVNKKATKYHLSPITLIPVIIRLQQRQGMKTLWKGASGVFIIRGFAVALETLIAELTPFPREISINSSIKHLLQHLLLKSMTFGILTPFFASSLVETIQSDIASEKPGVFDCLKEGICRLFNWGMPQSTRLLPIWSLVVPTVAYGIMNYIISSVAQYIFLHALTRFQNQQQGAIPKSRLRSAEKYFDNIATVQFGAMFAEALLYPYETVLNRLYIQGTRTIIDNLDSGTSVLPIITKYESPMECFHTIIHEEGNRGLYKGFGALIMEYALQALIIKCAKTTFHEIAAMFPSSSSHSPSVSTLSTKSKTSV